jgi:XTP/dITP diphosphohydrolase
VRVTLLRTSPGVAPGLLTREAWRSLEAADRILSDDAGQTSALAREGMHVELVDDLHGTLVERCEADEHVVVLAAGEIGELPGADLTSVLASFDAPGSAFVELVAVMDRLRRDCPWDREQTHRSLAKYLLEETYETLEAIETGDRDHLREELGDLLLQVCFHARIASEDADGGFGVDDVARGIAEKLVYRHPHVFAGLEVADADEVDRNWEALKAAEKKRDSPLEGIPVALPALAYADKVLGRLTKAGLVEDPVSGQADLGGRLLDLVVQARAAGLDPEQELRSAVRRVIEDSRRADG